MKVRNGLPKNVLFLLALLLSFNLLFLHKVFSYEFITWSTGSIGYETALYNAEQDDKPLVLYFYLSSGEWNDKMTNDYIAKYDVEDYLLTIPKVAINPDMGEEELKLTKKYGVDRFPAFLITIPSLETKPQRIHPFSKDKNMSVNEFIGAVQDFFVYQYSEKAFSLVEEGEYEKAMECLEKAMKYDPDDAYPYYAIANIYHTNGAEEKNAKLFKKAEEYYKKALKIDPDYKECKAGLEKLLKDKGKVNSK